MKLHSVGERSAFNRARGDRRAWSVLSKMYPYDYKHGNTVSKKQRKEMFVVTL